MIRNGDVANMKMSPEEFNDLFNRIDNSFVLPEQLGYNYQKKYADYFAGKGPILDIGCGHGAFLRALKEKNINAMGIDLDYSNYMTCNKKGYNCIHGDAFEHLDKIGEKFDKTGHYGGISLIHVIEHFDGITAVKLLVLIFEALKNDGVFVLITPDFSDENVHKDIFWLSSTHIRPYPPRWLINAFHKIGFDVISSGKDSDVGDLFIVGIKRDQKQK